MNNKGFTLIELIVAIGIMGMLMVLASPAVMSMKNATLEKAYENKIKLIENASRRWGADKKHLIPSYIDYTKCPSDEPDEIDRTCLSACAIVPVYVLVNEGYVVPDKDENEGDLVSEKTIFSNPIDGSSMNDMCACVRYNSNDALNREIVTFVMTAEECR